MCFESTGSGTESAVDSELTIGIEILPTKLLPLFDGDHVGYLLYYFSYSTIQCT
jgi:hypothetical protein